jgi:hypothetical protein
MSLTARLERKWRGQDGQQRHASGILTADLERLLTPEMGDRPSRGDHLVVPAAEDGRAVHDEEHQARLGVAVGLDGAARPDRDHAHAGPVPRSSSAATALSGSNPGPSAIVEVLIGLASYPPPSLPSTGSRQSAAQIRLSAALPVCCVPTSNGTPDSATPGGHDKVGTNGPDQPGRRRRFIERYVQLLRM